jgi:hypothetical protein
VTKQGRILNLHHTKGVVPDGAVRIDRKTRWGNKFAMQDKSQAERERVTEEHKKDLWARIRKGEISLEALAALDGSDLACWCAPKGCHGDTLREAARWAAGQLAKAKVDPCLG